jgi:hypothetical protein
MGVYVKIAETPNVAEAPLPNTRQLAMARPGKILGASLVALALIEILGAK